MDKKKILFIAKILAVFIIPSMYTITYLSANSDPYGKMNEVPVAIINLDEGVSIEGEDINVGQEVADGMIADNGFDFQEIPEENFSYDDYFMKITIPENFSDSIVNFTKTGYQQAKITMSVDESKNYIFSSIAFEALYEMQSQIDSDIVSEYVNAGLDITNYFTDYFNDLSTEVSDEIINVNTEIDNFQNILNQKLSDIENYDYQGDIDKVKNDLNSKLNDLNVYINNQITKIEDDINNLFDQLIADINNVTTTNPIEASIKEQIVNNIVNIQTEFNNKAGQLNQILTDKVNDLKQKVNDYNNDDVEQFKADAQVEIDSIMTSIDNVNQDIDGYQDEIMNNDYLYAQLDPIENVEDMVSFFAEPVVIETNRENAVENYGYGLAPYFVSLSLFVGAIILMTVFEFKEIIETKFLRKQRNILFFYAMFPLMQVLVMFALLNIINHFNFIHPLLFIGYSWLVGLAFNVLIIMLVLALEDIGKFIGFTLLVLQLGASAGTFPIEVSPTFFKIIHPFLPMSYTIVEYRKIFFVDEITFSNAFIYLTIFIIIGTVIINMMLKKKLQKSGY